MERTQDNMQRPNRIAIANIGRSKRGKTSTIRKVYNILSTKYPSTTNQLKGIVEIKATIKIGNVLVGFESKGDPGSRQGESLREFVNLGCDVILCACRTQGETKQNVVSLRGSGYSIIWASNVRPDKSAALYRDLWNDTYAEDMAKFIEDYALGKI